MHAARAIHKQREKREEKIKLEVRRPSLTSQFKFPRSPAISIDATARRAQSQSDEDRLNFSYVGFIVAIFGAVPLIVGTFVNVPALWEVGLGVTLVGIFIGLVFWIIELCAEAKKYSHKRSKLTSRGKIEDSNLLQVPDRKFRQSNGLESRRGSLQNDSTSLINPGHNSLVNAVNNLNHFPGAKGLRGDSLSEYSLSDTGKSDESSNTLHLNGTIGGRRVDGRVVSLQNDLGADDDSDSDAETVIEAPTGKPKIIQVQTLQNQQGSDSLPSVHSGLDCAPEGAKPLTTSTSFSLENETTLPHVSQHRTVLRIPVMPQEVEKLKKCECGRYLIDNEKLLNMTRYHYGGGSMPPTSYNSPALSMIPPLRKVFGSSEAIGTSGKNYSSNDSSNNDIPSDFQLPPPSLLPDTAKSRISLNSNVSNVSRQACGQSGDSDKSADSGVDGGEGESSVQMEPVLSRTAVILNENIKSESSLGSGQASEDPDGTVLQDIDGDHEKILSELLELTDVDSLEPATIASTEEVMETNEISTEQEESKPTATRPTSLSLSPPVMHLNPSNENLNIMNLVSPASTSSASTVISGTNDESEEEQLENNNNDTPNIDNNNEPEINANEPSSVDDNANASVSVPRSASMLAKDMSLDELLDTIEQAQENEKGSSEGLAVEVQ